MLYISTRGKAEPKPFKDILLEGLAPGGGLYMPEQYTQLPLKMLRGKSYADVAHFVLSRFAPDIPERDLADIIAKTYTKETFGSDDITPLLTLAPGLKLLRLSNGPTLSFKDVPLQLLGNLMEYVLNERGEERNILGATSGDTGSAAAYALRGKKNLRLFTLSPHGRMSRFQQRQMYTLNEPNISNLVVNGTFDDCQTTVKKVNEDAEFKEKFKIGAVNSINWARIAAQVVYYVYAYLKATESDDEMVDFSVPSGNFGNAFSAHVARQMGLPIRCIIVATNENDVLHEFFRTGIYRIRKKKEVLETSSPSMDIAEASNLERLIFDCVGRDAKLVCELWDDLRTRGAFGGRFITRRFGHTWLSGRADEMNVMDIIRDVYKKYGIVIDPHTAVGMHVGLMCAGDLPSIPLIVDETAHPAKFAEVALNYLGLTLPAPKGYEQLAELPEYTTPIEPDAEAVKAFIAARVP